jgi:protoheme IX farnesyltransferase
MSQIQPGGRKRSMQLLSIYRELAKSGIVALVLISVLGGYLAGHPFEQPLSLGRMIHTLMGIFLLAAGSSALNQLQEVRTDSAMPRTARRPIPSGRITVRHAAIFCGVTLGAGLALLYLLDFAVFWMGIAAVFSYNVLYTLWWKRHWAFAAIPGAIPGALPILMGYTAAHGDPWAPGGLFLFFILFYWQMPHFWSLAIRFRDDYAQGGVPTLPVSHGDGPTRFHIMLWSFTYVALGFAGTFFLRTGWVYLVIAALTGAKVLQELAKYLKASELNPGDQKPWLPYFLWVNFSLIFYVFGAVADLWSVYLVPYIKG